MNALEIAVLALVGATYVTLGKAVDGWVAQRIAQLVKGRKVGHR